MFRALIAGTLIWLFPVVGILVLVAWIFRLIGRHYQRQAEVTELQLDAFRKGVAYGADVEVTDAEAKEAIG